jgi:hypothetical protein
MPAPAPPAPPGSPLSAAQDPPGPIPQPEVSDGALRAGNPPTTPPEAARRIAEMRAAHLGMLGTATSPGPSPEAGAVDGEAAAARRAKEARERARIREEQAARLRPLGLSA